MSLFSIKLVFLPSYLTYLARTHKNNKQDQPTSQEAQRAVTEKPCHPWHHSYHLQRDPLMLRLHLCSTRSFVVVIKQFICTTAHAVTDPLKKICVFWLFCTQEGKGLWHWHLTGRKVRGLYSLSYLDISDISFGRKATTTILKQSFSFRNSTLLFSFLQKYSALWVIISYENEKRPSTICYIFCSKITA